MLGAEFLQRLVDQIQALFPQLELVPGQIRVARLESEGAAVVGEIKGVIRLLFGKRMELLGSPFVVLLGAAQSVLEERLRFEKLLRLVCGGCRSRPGGTQ